MVKATADGFDLHQNLRPWRSGHCFHHWTAWKAGNVVRDRNFLLGCKQLMDIDVSRPWHSGIPSRFVTVRSYSSWFYI